MCPHTVSTRGHDVAATTTGRVPTTLGAVATTRREPSTTRRAVAATVGRVSTATVGRVTTAEPAANRRQGPSTVTHNYRPAPGG